MGLTADLSELKIAEAKAHTSIFRHFRREYMIIDTELDVLAEARFYVLSKHTYCKLFINAPGFDGYGQGFSRAIGMSQELDAFKKAVKSAGITFQGDPGSVNEMMEAMGAKLTEYRYRIVAAHP